VSEKEQLWCFRCASYAPKLTGVGLLIGDIIRQGTRQLCDRCKNEVWNTCNDSLWGKPQWKAKAKEVDGEG